MKSLISIILISSLVTGCTYFTRPLDQPVIEEKLNPRFLSPGTVGTLSLTPERRVVLVNFKNNRFCAAAPTEIGIAVSQVKKLAANAKKGSDIEAALEMLIASANNNTVLNRRTQGMQLFLSSSYFICQMYMNGAVSEYELLDMQIRVLNAVAPLIQEEIGYMYSETGAKAYDYKVSGFLDRDETLKSLHLKNGDMKNVDEKKDEPKPIPAEDTK